MTTYGLQSVLYQSNRPSPLNFSNPDPIWGKNLFEMARKYKYQYGWLLDSAKRPPPWVGIAPMAPAAGLVGPPAPGGPPGGPMGGGIPAAAAAGGGDGNGGAAAAAGGAGFHGGFQPQHYRGASRGGNAAQGLNAPQGGNGPPPPGMGGNGDQGRKGDALQQQGGNGPPPQPPGMGGAIIAQGIDLNSEEGMRQFLGTLPQPFIDWFNDLEDNSHQMMQDFNDMSDNRDEWKLAHDRLRERIAQSADADAMEQVRQTLDRDIK